MLRRRPGSRVPFRFRGSLVVACVLALAAPAAASAHPRGPAVALDYRLRVVAAELPHVRVQVLDADRELRLRVSPAATLVVRGLLGEPMLRFDRDGVWANDSSPTAQNDKVGRRGGSGWRKLTAAHSFAWHDHRLSPPRLAAGQTAAWSLPVELDGRSVSIRGEFIRVARPLFWPWLVGAALFATAAVALGRILPRKRASFATLSAALAAAAALAASAGFATGDPLSGTQQWLELACTAVMAVAAAAALRARSVSTRSWAASAIGAVAFAFALPSLGVFRHGVVVSSFPPNVVRFLDAVALVAGLAAVGLGLTSEDEAVRPQAKRRQLVEKGV